MPWWGWIVIGAVMLGAELFVVEADFYLVFLGISAALSGLLALAVPALPMWAQWLIFAALSLVSMVFFRKRVYDMVRGGRPDMQHDLIGQVLQVADALAPGQSCRVEYRGSTWTARNDSQAAIQAGGRARITGVDGIVLRVESVG